jgi:hypothetical protein
VRFWILLLAPGVASGYDVKRTADGIPLRWPEGTVRCSVDDDASEDLSGPSEVGAVHAALATWSAIPGSPVEVRPASADDDTPSARVSWWPDWEEQADALALTVVTYDVESGEILDAEIRVNDAVDWTIGAESGAGGDASFDVQNTLAHEVGHLLGMAHSDAGAATMYARSAPREIQKRDLHEDDLAGFAYLYDVTPPAAEPSAAPRGGACSTAPAAPNGRLASGALLLVVLALGRRATAVAALLVAAAAARAESPDEQTRAALARADQVVVARVVSAEARWIGGTIFTDTQVDVVECLRGRCAARVVVRQLGGEVGPIGQSVEGTADLRAGEDMLLLLRTRGDGTSQPVGMSSGALRIVGHEAVDASGGVQPLEALRRLCAGRGPLHLPMRASEQRAQKPVDGRVHPPRPEQRRRHRR